MYLVPAHSTCWKRKPMSTGPMCNGKWTLLQSKIKPRSKLKLHTLPLFCKNNRSIGLEIIEVEFLGNSNDEYLNWKVNRNSKDLGLATATITSLTYWGSITTPWKSEFFQKEEMWRIRQEAEGARPFRRSEEKDPKISQGHSREQRWSWDR